LSAFYAEQPFTPWPQESLRYYFENEWYSYSDGIFLYCMLRLMHPKRVVEVGAGFSSLLMMDTNERYFDGAMKHICIDPDGGRLRARCKPGDGTLCHHLAAPVQQVPLEYFEEVQSGDILFVDSSHVSSPRSDVNHIFFEILPRLRPGVLVHFHDMFYPFEYPDLWIQQGWPFNEAYVLRAFLQFNSSFQILVWNQYLATYHRRALEEAMPLCLRNTGGSLWLGRQ
jgi:predicted O-methyltransferase YrrM